MAATKDELKSLLRERQSLSMRLELVVAELRRRNGEISDILQRVAPEEFEKITPTVPDSRYTRSWNLIEACIEWVSSEPDTDTKFNLLEKIESHALGIYEFNREYLDNRKKLTPEHIAAMQEGRKKNKA